jgi:hypothetical protein
MATTKTEQIFVQINDEIVELTGKDKENFIAEREANKQIIANADAEIEAKKQARADIFTKLGLTEEELALLGL